MAQMIAFLAFFTITAHSAHSAEFSYTQKEQNGYIVGYTQPRIELEGKIYPLDSYYTSTAVTAFCTAMGHTRPDHYLNEERLRTNVEAVYINRDGARELRPTKNPIETLFCVEPIATATPSTHYQSRAVNADGSFTILEPRFQYLSKELFFIADGHDICKLYGGVDSGAYRVVYEPETPDMDTMTWAAFFGFDGPSGEYFQLGIWNSWPRPYERVSSITCTPRP